IHLQFCHSNATTTRAMYYTGQFNIKCKVQGWLLQKSNKDAHYCATLFWYLQEFCIQYPQLACLISADDKHKILIEEDIAISIGVQNRCLIVLQESTLATADHDFSKLFLIPSVFVLYEDTVFEPSTAIRHSTEF
ncbi:7123_t:CDS:2, partial [Gigaspora margarita]